jgi:hypothetical protein
MQNALKDSLQPAGQELTYTAATSPSCQCPFWRHRCKILWAEHGNFPKKEAWDLQPGTKTLDACTEEG